MVEIGVEEVIVVAKVAAVVVVVFVTATAVAVAVVIVSSAVFCKHLWRRQEQKQKKRQ